MVLDLRTNGGGSLSIKGVMQTPVGGTITVQAKVDGNVVGQSQAFAVCAHPSSVEWVKCTTIDTADEAGLKAEGKLKSDSGDNAHLGQVQTMELISAIVKRSGSFAPAKKGGKLPINFAEETGTFFAASEPCGDKVSMKKADIGDILLPGSATVNQVMVFYCKRCNMPASPPFVVPNSGCEHVRTIVSDDMTKNVIVFQSDKTPAAVTYHGGKGDFSSAAATASVPLTSTVNVPIP